MTFEDKLRAFFKKHDPGREYLAPRLARKFMKNKDVVMVHLAKRYAQGGVQFKGYAKAIEAAPAAPALEEAYHEDPVAHSEAETAIPEMEANEEAVAEVAHTENGAEHHEEGAEMVEAAEEGDEEANKE